MRSFLPPCGDGTELESIYAHYSKFSPPYGDGTASYEKLVTLFKFSLPYGDGTGHCNLCVFVLRFSPPYGDGTICLPLEQQKGWFSPPYGDGTLCQWAPITSRRFSPPYGDSTDETFGYQEAWAFPSPCEDKLKSMLLTPTTWASSFRPLAGMVPATFDIETTNTEFSPPYGDCIRMTTPKYPVMELSPPYGDGTSASVASAHDL